MATQKSHDDLENKATPAVGDAPTLSRMNEGEAIPNPSSTEGRSPGGLSSIPGGKSKQFTDTVKEGWATGKERASSFAHSAQDYAFEWVDTARGLASSAGESTSVVVRRYPIISVAAGFGFGCLLGVLINRRK